LAGYEQTLGQAGVEAQSFPTDAANAEALQSTFFQIKAHLGTPQVLVYNAAAVRPGLPSEIEVEQVLADFRINVVGALVCAQQVIPDMKAEGRGTILFTGGGLALRPTPQYASLASSKAALRNLTSSLAEEVEASGIHVATVTIAGFVKPGTHFDPALIAKKYWELHSQEPGQWEKEFVYKAER
jgi:short-subunit dehydrogenase